MKNLFWIIIFSFLIGCKSNSIINSNNEILILNNENYKSVAFQANYAKRFFEKDTTKIIFFDIDLNTVEFLNKNIKREFCLAQYNWSKDQWNLIIETVKEQNNKDLLDQYDYFNKNSLNDCVKIENELDYYDRQFIGINSPSNKKVIFIQLFDLRKESANFKKNLETDFIIGYHGFFESSKYKTLQFLVDEKRFTYSGYENSPKNQKIIKFEIKDEYGILPGVSISSNDSTFVVTNFDGLANLIIEDKTERVELSYMGKPTFVKIIPNCDFIKVDLSKRKAFYYKDNKFIKSKKLIFE